MKRFTVFLTILLGFLCVTVRIVGAGLPQNSFGKVTVYPTIDYDGLAVNVNAQGKGVSVSEDGVIRTIRINAVGKPTALVKPTQVQLPRNRSLHSKAIRFIRNTVVGKDFTFVVDKRFSAKRVDAYIYPHGGQVGELSATLVGYGLATTNFREVTFDRALRHAKRNHLGIWAKGLPSH